MASEIFAKKSNKEWESFHNPPSARFPPDSRLDSALLTQTHEEDNREGFPTNESTTTLYSLVKSKNWNSVLQYCNGPDRKEASIWVVQKDGDFEWKSLPIHMACELQAPYSVVRALLESFDPAVRMRDYLQRLPLHIACHYRASYDVIALLIDAYPDATKVPDNAGCVPLHYACRKGIHEKVIQKLLTLNHRGAYSTDTYSMLPIHWACKHSASLAVVESLLRAHPHSVDSLDRYGRCPIDIAKQTPSNVDRAEVLDALSRDAAFWTMSLIQEVESLKTNLIEMENSMKQSFASRDDEINRLQTLLSQVTEASSEASKNFKHMKAELEYENVSLKNQVKKLTQESLMYEERIEVLSDENDHLVKDMELQDGVLIENKTLKLDVKKLREDATNYKKQMTELFDDNVRLTQEVNRLTERLDHFTNQMKRDNNSTNIGEIFRCG